MKLAHISDLHIGKRMYGYSLAEDQNYILGKLLDLMIREQVDGVLLAGDIYDKPAPSAEAVQIFDRFLTGLAQAEIPLYAISGNHDSPERLAFGARLMSSRRIYLSQVYGGQVERISCQDQWGEADIYLLPYLRPALAQEALKGIQLNPQHRNVLVAHQFVTGAACCESEELAVGGLDQMDGSLFQDFDYVALGHIHSPQQVGRPELRYCGTPLKYSFSEAEQEKSLTIVELREKGQIQIDTIPLKPLRELRKIRGTYLELTARSFYQDANTQDYIQAVLTDEEDIPAGLQKLRIIYPNLMCLEYDNCRTRENRQIQAPEQTQELSELELFAQFYELQNNQPFSETQEAFVKMLIGEMQEGEESKA